jgi:hypothetical protein
MARLLRVRILEPWNGYNADSTVTMTEAAYYRIKSEGVKLSIVTGTLPVLPVVEDQLDFDMMHDRPFLVPEEEE